MSTIYDLDIKNTFLEMRNMDQEAKKKWIEEAMKSRYVQQTSDNTWAHHVAQLWETTQNQTTNLAPPPQTNWKVRHDNFTSKLVESGVVSQNLLEGTRVVLSMLTLDHERKSFLQFSRYKIEPTISNVHATELLYAAALPHYLTQANRDRESIFIVETAFDLFDEVADELYEQVWAHRNGGLDQNEPRKADRSAAA